jgi:hypothetical protein
MEEHMDPLVQKFQEIKWQFADRDPAALTELETRIAAAGRQLKLITYSELARGVIFHIPNIRDGAGYEIRTYDWHGLDRKIIGKFLGLASARSYETAGFMASALVVSGTEYKPSDIFFDWMKTLDVLPDLSESTVLKFWADQVNKAHRWYRAH